MKCPTCTAESCYVCRNVIEEKVKYTHFCFCDCSISRRGHITRLGHRKREICRSCGKCSLWHVEVAKPIPLDGKPKPSCACVVS